MILSRIDNAIRAEGARWHPVAKLALFFGTGSILVFVVLFGVIGGAFTNSVDNSLQVKAKAVAGQLGPSLDLEEAEAVAAEGRALNPGSKVAVIPPGRSAAVGDVIAADSTRTGAQSVGDQRVMVNRVDNGATVIVSRNVEGFHRAQDVIRAAGLFVFGAGAAFAVARRDLFRRTPSPGYDVDAVEDLLGELGRNRRASQNESDIVAFAGHEIKNMLTPVRANFEFLVQLYWAERKNLVPHEELAEVAKDVLIHIEATTNLVGDLVDQARERSDAVEKRPVDVSGIIYSVEEWTRLRHRQTAVSVETTPWIVEGIPFHLELAVLNLVDNAAKWSPPGGVVRVVLGQIAEDQAELIISDSGPGIVEDDRERVFEHSYRSAAASTTTGAGIGLALVRQVVEEHGGTVAAETSDDGGTKMRVVLPGHSDNTAEYRPICR